MRPRNEDSLGWGRIGASTEPGESTGLLFAIADGLGAYGGGDVASAMAVRTLLDHGRKVAPGSLRAAQLLRSGFESANLTVFDAALRGVGTAKMQTTMLALLFSAGEAHMAHVGDCRAYRHRRGAVELLSTDHTQAMEMMRMRLISPEQAADHPARHALTRSLGADLIARVDVRKEPLLPGDSFLICSDGLWGKLTAGEIRDALAADDLDQELARLIQLAIERGGEDNATGTVIRVLHTADAPARPQGWRRFFLSS